MIAQDIEKHKMKRRLKKLDHEAVVMSLSRNTFCFKEDDFFNSGKNDNFEIWGYSSSQKVCCWMSSAIAIKNCVSKLWEDQ